MGRNVGSITTPEIIVMVKLYGMRSPKVKARLFPDREKPHIQTGQAFLIGSMIHGTLLEEFNSRRLGSKLHGLDSVWVSFLVMHSFIADQKVAATAMSASSLHSCSERACL
jgi:hypothetical protein